MTFAIAHLRRLRRMGERLLSSEGCLPDLMNPLIFTGLEKA